MTDLHTHILPGMDDGARTCSDSVAMLKMEWEQGVQRVALTPHFYPEMENVSSFLSRRGEAFDLLRRHVDTLPREGRASVPELVLGAEVAWIRGMGDMPGLDRLCYADSPYLLIELPFSRWDNRVLDDINDIINRTGLIPVIAHIDRYIAAQSDRQMERLLEFDLPIQISAEAFQRLHLQRQVRKLLETGMAQLLISDCHNTGLRAPNLNLAYARVTKKYGKGFAEKIDRCSDRLLNG